MTRWKVVTPLRLDRRTRAAQSMGEWPGERRTLPRGFGVEVMVVGASELLLLLTRCWLLEGNPRLGRGPDEGTRRADAGLGGGAIAGRLGGGIRPAEPD